MLSVENIELSFGGRRLFDEISFFVGPGEKVGLTGKNGAGKSTLLKVILGDQNIDSGRVNLPRETVLGYLPQEMQHDEESTPLETAFKAFEKAAGIEAEIEELNKQLSERTDYESDSYMDLAQRLADANTELALLNPEEREARAQQVLLGLGFTEQTIHKKMSQLSGGWKMRAELARLLLQNPDILLLDEPTNHLDIDSLEWLERYLKEYPGAIMLISHDRAFLDNITTRTLEVSNGDVYDYKAPYSKYVELRKADIEKQKREKKNQEKYIKHTEQLIDKFRAKKNKAAFAQSLIKKLDKLEEIEVDEFDSSKMEFRFPPAPRSGKVVWEGENVTKAYADKPVFSDLDFSINRGEKVALIGQNGVGKTTLLRIINEIEDFKGKANLGHNVSIGYFGQYQAEQLNPNKTVYDTILDEADEEMRPKVRHLLGAFLFSGEDVFKKVKVLSGGERSRLALCKLMLRSHNFLVLDEPTNHLDIPSKEMLKKALNQYQGTLLIVSHDRDFLADLTTQVNVLKPEGMSVHYGDIYDFLDARQSDTIAELERDMKIAKETSKNGSGNGSEKQGKKDYHAQKASEKDRRKLSKQISRLEDKISSLEEEIEGLNQQLANPPESTDEIEKLSGEVGKKHEELDAALSEWEEAVQQMESYDS